MRLRVTDLLGALPPRAISISTAPIPESPMSPIRERTQSFCKSFGLKLPILLGPMAGASEPSLSIGVMNAGGLGACGALLMQPQEILAWAEEVRREGQGPFQLNLWIPEPP